MSILTRLTSLPVAAAVTFIILLTGTLIGITAIALPSDDTINASKVTLTNVVTEVNGNTGETRVTALIEGTGKKVTVWGSENSSRVSPSWQGGEAWPATVDGRTVYVLTSAETTLAGLKGIAIGFVIGLILLGTVNALYLRGALHKQRSENIIAAALS